MKRFLPVAILCASIGIPGLTHADRSTLTIKNQVENVNVSIVTDLLCGKFVDFITPSSARYTSPLEENPIQTTETPVIVTWENCAIVSKEFTENSADGDHSKVSLDLVDLITGEHQPVILQASDKEENSQEVTLSDRKVTVKMTHSGDYGYIGIPADILSLKSTATTITIE